jgi:hypothetical protein
VEFIELYTYIWKKFELNRIIKSLLNEKIELDYFISASLICNAFNFELIVFNSTYDCSYVFLPKGSEIKSDKSSNCIVVSQKTERNKFVSLIPFEKRIWNFPKNIIQSNKVPKNVDIQRIQSITFKIILTEQIPIEPFICGENKNFEGFEINQKLKIPGKNEIFNYLVVKSNQNSLILFKLK